MVEYYKHIEEEYRGYMNRYPPTHEQNMATVRFLMEKLGKLSFNSVFEVGMGYGLMAKEILNTWQIESYCGMDLSVDQMLEAERYLHGLDTQQNLVMIRGDIIKYRGVRTYDLVFCTTVLSHIPPNYIRQAVNNMASLSRKHVIIVEPMSPKLQLERPDDQWIHHYYALFPLSFLMVEIEAIPHTLLYYARFEKEERV